MKCSRILLRTERGSYCSRSDNYLKPIFTNECQMTVKIIILCIFYIAIVHLKFIDFIIKIT